MQKTQGMYSVHVQYGILLADTVIAECKLC